MSIGGAEKMAKTCKEIISTWKRINAITTKVSGGISEIGVKSFRKAQADQNHLHRHLEKLAHEVHCIAVEEGLAEPDESRYGEFIERPDGWHEYKVIRRRPYQ